MRTDFTNLRDALTAVLDTMEATIHGVVATANEQRKELLELYGRMTDTRADLVELGGIAGDVGSILIDLDELADDVAAKMGDAMECGADRVPEIDYEDVVEYCDVCGRAIRYDEYYSETGSNWVTCDDCANPHSTIEVDDGQMSIDDIDTDGDLPL